MVDNQIGSTMIVNALTLGDVMCVCVFALGDLFMQTTVISNYMT